MPHRRARARPRRPTLADAWRDGPQAYLGTTVAGFPNLFLLIGPNTGLGHTSMIYMIESQTGLHRGRPPPHGAASDCDAVEVRPEAQADVRRRDATAYAAAPFG